ncbi:pentatricopeptide repeat-containing protein At4g04370 [Andrographis paniculata]|uniref:pentatricopeptide repeat-containing protein At4g04370 n=1 Tax=Andrographis paniculata TaxID=175694 RepID=UPI0021E800CC|nr:pentatricopeptide repeat-containing protein At4g04370 [Andrographis paniculata]XP_051135292.1 pentatricopeptide repeat-containing protein At4g04370 [Andrographis paniculata]
MRTFKLTSIHHRKPPGIAAGAATTNFINATISRLSSQGLHREVLIAFASMLKSPATAPDAFTYPSLLKACTSLGFDSLGVSLHQQVIVNGYSSDSYISSSLINFYAKLRNTEYARKVFDDMPQRNIVPWTAIIWCYSNARDMNNAFSIYNSLQREGIVPSSITILNMLTGVSESRHVDVLHACIIKNGYLRDVILINCLLSVYAKCGRVEDARELFDLLDDKDLVSWNSLINAYSLMGNITEVVKLFTKMRFESIEPDQQTFGSLVSAIAREGCEEVGRIVHGLIVSSGFESEKHVGTSLVSFYSRCRRVDEALRIFEMANDRDTVFWTAMISGLVQSDSADKALALFRKMLVSGVLLSAATIACVLAACAQLGSIKLGKSIHCYMLRQKMALDIPSQNSLVTLYAKCGFLDQSFTVFSMMAGRDVISWNAIVAGYAQNGYLDQSLHLFHEMRLDQQQPDSVTIICLLQACASLGACHHGKLMHNFVIRSFMGPCIRIGTALVDMYAKCGDLGSARKCFDRMPQHDTVSWSTIIAAYGSNGKGETAMEMYSKYLQDGLELNDVIFLSVLYACSHNGLVDCGLALFESMKNDHNIEPKTEHCACIVDLLCRAGRVHDAYDFYRKTFAKPMVDVLGILLDACRNYGAEQLGCIIANEISEIEPADGGKYVQLAHTFASMARWDGVGEAWAQMRSLGLRKLPGWSFIEMHGVITPFFTRHTSHPEYASIVSILKNLTEETKEVELVPEHEDFILDCDVL